MLRMGKLGAGDKLGGRAFSWETSTEGPGFKPQRCEEWKGWGEPWKPLRLLQRERSWIQAEQHSGVMDDMVLTLLWVLQDVVDCPVVQGRGKPKGREVRREAISIKSVWSDEGLGQGGGSRTKAGDSGVPDACSQFLHLLMCGEGHIPPSPGEQWVLWKLERLWLTEHYEMSL